MAKKAPLDKRKIFEANIVLAIACLVVYFFFTNHYSWILLSSVFAICGLVLQPLGKVIARMWYWIAEVIGAVMSRVVLFLMFFLVLTPIAVFYQLFAKNRMKRLTTKESYFVERNHLYTEKDFLNPW